MQDFFDLESTICAISSPEGVGGVALVRVTGKQAITVSNKLFSKDLTKVEPRTAVYGKVLEGNTLIDEVLITVFPGPASFTGDDVVEIACHGSRYVQKKVLELLCTNGARLAQAGEFTKRAYLNKKMDLTQAEGIGDLIHSETAEQHRLAVNQMRGGIKDEIQELRQQLLDLASLFELELDFSQEDVEFADRTQMLNLIDDLQTTIISLLESFNYGNAIKNGVPVAIVGPPNAGKSTLLNALLKEDKAIVSDIAGTTRDSIEDQLVLNGVSYRFIDTAGLRETTDTIEQIGIERSHKRAEEATIVLYLLDSTATTDQELKEAQAFAANLDDTYTLLLWNKSKASKEGETIEGFDKVLHIAAKEGAGLKALELALTNYVQSLNIQSNSVLTSMRHVAHFTATSENLERVRNGLEGGIPTDIVAMDLREALYQLGEVTGEVTNDELLGNIFSSFCIGK